ncbi:histidinol dehydrogenase [Litorilinea aerophila]|uniref:histidinol dehydrogenase n=1 Tax=Litorilinea aerophila TaxID=1204385 RepID=UPI001477413B|nr:histidinol dehydrogenase [Litorilinea aerophila]MCC9077629.1 histidinol dehydrogenase [Litorilinea aerophila]GIV79763.1 MAG: histidinol dehydrogenase [Litorilinea sp.]
MDVSTARRTILRRPAWDEIQVPDQVLDRNQALFGERLTPDEAVRRILADVRTRGDEALRAWTARLDGVEVPNPVVDGAAIQAAYDQVEPSVVDALRVAARRIEAFHRRQPALSWIHNDHEGTVGQLVRPIERVGVYIPGGTAPLPSSLLMTAIPARVAGVPHVAVITPPQRESGLPHPATLVAADIAGVDVVYAAGGAQAIGALAFGTESVRRVDKICGPGNLYVTLAKRQVFGLVGIDGLPGPTETVVIADEHANPELAAADLLAQAEHDILACAILLTPSRPLAEAVQAAVLHQMEELERSETIQGSLARGSGIVVTENLDQAFELANEYAPEHLCLLVADPWRHLEQVRHAGGVFLGEGSFEVLGDYVAGPSHVMPTGGTARFASPINVNDFVKIVSIVGLNAQALAAIGPAAATLAHAEGLTGHAAAVRRRLQDESPK